MYKKRAQGWLKHLDFVLLDIACLMASYLLAYLIRHRTHFQEYWKETYTTMLFLLPILDIAVILVTNTFKDVLKRSVSRELFITIRQDVIVIMGAILYLYGVQTSFYFSRLTMGYMALLYLLLSYTVRMVWKNHLIRTNGGRDKRSLLIVTGNEQVDKVIDNILYKKYEAYQITGIAVLDCDRVGEKVRGIPIVARQENLLDYICYEWVDEVFFNMPRRMRYPKELEEKIVSMGVPVHRKLATANRAEGIEQSIDMLGNYTVLTTSLNVIAPWQLAVKRLMDIVISLVGIIITLILIVIIGPMIYAKSPGPIIFRQERVGRNGKKFGLYKFRSMYLDAEQRKKDLQAQNNVKDGMMFKMDEDPRIIGSRILPDGTYRKGIGNFIRDYSLDEFPQFFNVLKGEMSVVGTRPPTLDEWNRYEYRHRARLAIKPGITGMWQVNGRSTITDFEKVVALDKSYIENYSIWLDIRIIFKTMRVVFKKEGAK